MKEQPIRRAASFIMTRRNTILKDRVNGILRESLSRELKCYGFHKRGDLYVRRLGELCHIIDVQRSRWNDTHRISVTINCGIYVPGVTSAYWNTPEPKQPKATDCCVSVRVGMLRTPWNDIWWEVSNDDGIEKAALIQADISSIIVELAMPFLNRFQTTLEVVRFLTEGRIEADKFVEPRADVTRLIYAGLLWRGLGERSRCSTCIDEAKRLSKKTPQEAVVVAFADRCKC